MSAVHAPGQTALEIEARQLGASGPEIPRVALGCGNFGGIGSSPDFFGAGLTDREAFAVMDAGWDLGLRHFDTADAYGGGRSETAIGRWIRARGRRPTLTTKTFNPMSADADHGLAPARIERQLKSSLTRLGLDHVEVYLAHEFDPDVPLADSIGAFEALAAAGRIGVYGVSNFDAAQLTAALQSGMPLALQNSYSLLEQGDRADVIPLCERRGIAYMAFSPLAGGWLTGKYRRGEPFPEGSRMTQRPEPYADLVRDNVYDQLDELGRLARERGTSVAGLALAWLFDDARISQIVLGPGRPEHLEPLREALEQPLGESDRAALSELFT
jgi:aryl-alcohol dehydrogenase-like predicted oxidoreductase